jgi:hypothetical protein
LIFLGADCGAAWREHDVALRSLDKFRKAAKHEGPRLAIKGQLRTNRLNFGLERTRLERASFLHTAPKLAGEQAGDFTWPPQLPVLQADAFSCSTWAAAASSR